MFTIVEQGGFQFKVAEGDTIRVPLIDVEAGTDVEIEKVLMVGGDDVKIGAPTIDDVKVTATVVEHGKGDKILVVKKKKRKDYKRHTGHRQDYTELKITSISA